MHAYTLYISIKQRIMILICLCCRSLREHKQTNLIRDRGADEGRGAVVSRASFSWIAGIGISAAVTFSTTGVHRGICYSQRFWQSGPAAQTIYGIWYFVSFYVLILAMHLLLWPHSDHLTSSGKGESGIEQHRGPVKPTPDIFSRSVFW